MSVLWFNSFSCNCAVLMKAPHTPPILFIGDLTFVQNFITLRQPLPGEMYVAQKKEKKNNTKYSLHFVPQQRPRAVHSLCSVQNWNCRLKEGEKEDQTLGGIDYYSLTYDDPIFDDEDY